MRPKLFFSPWKDGDRSSYRFALGHEKNYLLPHIAIYKSIGFGYHCVSSYGLRGDWENRYSTLEEAKFAMDEYVVEHNNAMFLTQEQYDKLDILI
jgi:hypothetical protein